jgi:hypothetical protein
MDAFLGGLVIGFFLGGAWVTYKLTPEVKADRVPAPWRPILATLGITAVTGCLGWVIAGWLLGK